MDNLVISASNGHQDHTKALSTVALDGAPQAHAAFSVIDEPKVTSASAGAPIDEFTYLVPRMEIGAFINKRRSEPGAPARFNDIDASNEWLQKMVVFSQLQNSEGAPLPRTSADVPSSMASLAQEVEGSELLQRAYQLAPTRVRMVDIANAAVYQQHVDMAHVDRLLHGLGENPNDQKVAELSLKIDDRQPEVRILQLSETSFVLTSSSNDLRALELVKLQADQLQGYDPRHVLSHVVGLAVGYSPNYLQVIEWGGRFYLVNGTHRAVALVKKGITTVPCVVMTPNNQLQFQLVSPPAFLHGSYHVQNLRPPLVKDYLNPDLTTVLKQYRCAKQVRVSVSFEETFAPIV